MLLCEKCGRVIQAYEVKYRLELDGRRRTVCNEDAKELLKAASPKGGAAEAKAAPRAKPALPAAQPPSPAGPAAAPAAKPAPPKLTPEELEARKKAALERAAAMKAQREAQQPKA